MTKEGDVDIRSQEQTPEMPNTKSESDVLAQYFNENPVPEVELEEKMLEINGLAAELLDVLNEQLGLTVKIVSAKYTYDGVVKFHIGGAQIYLEAIYEPQGIHIKPRMDGYGDIVTELKVNIVFNEKEKFANFMHSGTKEFDKEARYYFNGEKDADAFLGQFAKKLSIVHQQGRYMYEALRSVYNATNANTKAKVFGAVPRNAQSVRKDTHRLK